MIDLHSHILPGFDDGAKDDDVALKMLRIAAADGITKIVATPHVIEGEWLPSWESIISACTRLSQFATDQGINVNIMPGAEVAVHFDLLDRLIRPGPYCINGGKYILVELPASQIPAFGEEFFFVLQARGFMPVLAHPERHPEIARKPQILRNWIEKGLLVQMNGTSLTGEMGERIKKFAEMLLVNRMVHCLGSDAHGIGRRRPKLMQAAKKITTLVGRAAAAQIISANPASLLRGEDIEIPAANSDDYYSLQNENTFQKFMKKLTNT
ncbi:MAG: hypothetical protein P4N59_01410 [Negativicutes bacterium]|nr:hypothetical protein [Negativicutes bacterium]